ncbi:MAG: class I SAM-dependent methyltransferase [Pyrinomonadaceae bacterium]
MMTNPALYNSIGVRYNETRRADPYLASRFRELLAPQVGGNYLDVGCGTGNYTCALAGEEYQFYGIDPSDVMLENARRRDCNVIWHKGSAEALPFSDWFFSGAFCSLTIHHWRDLQKGFGQINRVLKPKSRFVLFTSLPEQTARYWLKHYFPKMISDSAGQMPSLSGIEEAMEAAGLAITKRENYFVRDDLSDHFLYCGKNRPELYLSEEIQRGISSFSSLANKDEVETGLKRLAEDIKKEKIRTIIEDHQNEEGDYTFLVAEANS